MSPRAAWRLESIGFTQVYDYVAGKADWGSFGLPLEGTKGARAGEHVRADVPTCRLEERHAPLPVRGSGARIVYPGVPVYCFKLALVTVSGWPSRSSCLLALVDRAD